MVTDARTYPNLYKDSVSLMKVSAEIMAVPGIEAASVVMATATNVENLGLAGLGVFEVRPNDLVVAVRGAAEACAAALETADGLIRSGGGGATGEARTEPVVSLGMAVARDPGINFALISVPGDYAAAEAMKALGLGLDVMIFSDNVPVAAEKALKEFAASRNLMVMGPDCGTAIVNGVPLGFANVVRRGAIGVVGASGTGTQEVTVAIDRLGAGVSQALGTGGHDLAEAIGGISMLHGLRALDADPGTEVIVLVSKPPAPRVAAEVLAAAEASAKPVVVIFLGADPATVTRPGVYAASTLAGAAELAVGLWRGETVGGKATPPPSVPGGPGRYVRGIFCGGTFCYEAQLILAAAGHRAVSNAPVAGNGTVEDLGRGVGNVVLDMGDDAFTQGRPHPMIDPSLRDARVKAEAADPEVAVVLFDVVLGYGSADDPVAGLVPVIAAARGPVFIGHVCGTDADPQGRERIIAALRGAGALVAGSNAEAAHWAAAVLSAREGRA